MLTNFAAAYQLCELDDDHHDIELSHCIAGTVTSMQDIGNDKFEYTIEDYRGRTEVIDTDGLKIYLNEGYSKLSTAVEAEILKAEMEAALDNHGWIFLTRASGPALTERGIHIAVLGEKEIFEDKDDTRIPTPEQIEEIQKFSGPVKLLYFGYLYEENEELPYFTVSAVIDSDTAIENEHLLGFGNKELEQLNDRALLTTFDILYEAYTNDTEVQLGNDEG